MQTFTLLVSQVRVVKKFNFKNYLILTFILPTSWTFYPYFWLDLYIRIEKEKFQEKPKIRIKIVNNYLIKNSTFIFIHIFETNKNTVKISQND